MALRLAVGEVTVLLGPAPARRDVMARLDDGTGRASEGGGAVRVVRLAAHRRTELERRIAAVRAACSAGASIVLVDRLTDGLDADGRRAVLVELRRMAGGGAAVLVDDADPVAALAVADGAVRTDADGGLAPVPGLDGSLDYLAS
ncbi:hypothetical protein [Pseudonocardia humida]|uniref:ABC transporter family protein n=1 Tax=Pseudonocardia humida TaxID=2800819 RepID=A0ABT1A920_9PSEU|nr:hypothetical protein [Pseudonocardia humida]MCO1659535.1 hypothetical protein [Pseudonocardia humida]